MEVDNEVYNINYCRNNFDEEAWNYRDSTCISGDMELYSFILIKRKCI